LNSLAPDKETAEAFDEVMEEVKKFFRPEFINRLDEIILFHKLHFQHMDKIIDIQIALLQKKLEDRKVKISIDKKAKEFLANHGYDPKFGARPLKRVIQKNLKNPLATLILEGRIKDSDTIKVSANDKELTFKN